MPRRRLDIDPEQVEKLASIGCTWREIAAVLGAGESTLRARFQRAYDRGRSVGHMSLRRALWKQGVERGNIRALIWLSKQRPEQGGLGFRDNIDIVAEVRDVTVEIVEVAGEPGTDE